jgi:hypothetical protein
MTKRFATLTSSFLLVVGIAAFTGSALAGNGNGNAPAPAASAQASGGPGNSENAPGQNKTSATTQGNGGSGSASQNTATSAGVKPTNATSKDTHALATSNKTKRYGNGTTAGQVAVQAGYTGMLHGPGNSQPHKAALCGGHEVDVHALKAPGQQKRCGSSTSGTSGSTSSTSHSNSSNTPSHTSSSSNSVSSSHSSSSTAPGHTVSGTVVAGTQGATANGNSAAGGVLGETASAGRSGPAGGVLGAVASVGQGVLPFTGFPLWLAVLIAVALVVLGLALVRRGRATA